MQYTFVRLSCRTREVVLTGVYTAHQLGVHGARLVAG